MKTNPEMIAALAESPVFKDYARNFGEATGLPLAIQPAGSEVESMERLSTTNRFCSLMSTSPEACQGCMKTCRELRRKAESDSAVVTCRFGLQEAAVPVRIGEATVGYLNTGQVLPRKSTERQIRRVAAVAGKSGNMTDLAAIRSAYRSAPVVSHRRLMAAVGLLSSFSQHLSVIGNQIQVRVRHQEPPVVTRAREYIRQHQGGDVKLAEVARAVHTSKFYFCKVFKKYTGVSFTEYVSRARIERARELLVNPHVRVSEIAFEVGFQSLTHFNRIFRKIMGESPTAYRLRLPSAVRAVV